MIIAAVDNVLSNSFPALVDIFLHYASPRQVIIPSVNTPKDYHTKGMISYGS